MTQDAYVTFCEAPGARGPSWGAQVKGACLVKGTGWAAASPGTSAILYLQAKVPASHQGHASVATHAASVIHCGSSTAMCHALMNTPSWHVQVFMHKYTMECLLLRECRLPHARYAANRAASLKVLLLSS